MQQYLTLLLLINMVKHQKNKQIEQSSSQNSQDQDSNQQSLSESNHQQKHSESKKKIKKKQKHQKRQNQNQATSIMSKEQFSRIYTTIESSMFFKINDFQADDIRNRIRNNPQQNNAENPQFGTKVRLASKEGTILCDPNLQTEEQIKDTASRVSAMLFTVYSLEQESLELFEQYVGSKLKDDANVIFITHEYSRNNSQSLRKPYTIIQSSLELIDQQFLQDFERTKRLLIIVKIPLHGKLRLIKFGKNQSLRVCITSSNMSFVDYHIGGNVFWARDFQPSTSQSSYRNKHERDFLQNLNQFLQRSISQNPRTVRDLVHQLFPLDHFKYDRLGNIKLILCPNQVNTDSRNAKYGLAKIQSTIKNTNKSVDYRKKRIVNIISPFKYFFNKRDYGKYQKLLQKMSSAFSSFNISQEGLKKLNTNKLRINQLTPPSYYIHNKYEGFFKQEMLRNPNHKDVLANLAKMHEDTEHRKNALRCIRNRDDICQFHEIKRLEDLRPSNYTPHHTKMVICTARKLKDKSILYRDIIFIGSQNMNLYSWGSYSQDGRSVEYKNLQIGVLQVGHSQEYTQNYIPFRINNDYHQEPLLYQDIAQYEMCQHDRRSQLRENFREQMSIQSQFFIYLRQMKQWFVNHFSACNNNAWQIQLYYPITSSHTQNQIRNIQFNDFQDYLGAVVQGSRQFLDNYNRVGGFYIADAVFIQKQANNDRIIKFILTLTSTRRKVSFSRKQIESILRQFKDRNPIEYIYQANQEQLPSKKERFWRQISQELQLE